MHSPLYINTGYAAAERIRNALGCHKHTMRAAAVCTVIVLAGCNATQTPTVSFDAEGYQYKGAEDPLLATPAAERLASLQERFDRIQARQ